MIISTILVLFIVWLVISNIIAVFQRKSIDNFVKNNAADIPLAHIYEIQKNSSRAASNGNLAITQMRQLLTDCSDKEIKLIVKALKYNESINYPRPFLVADYSDQVKKTFSGITITQYWIGVRTSRTNSFYFDAKDIQEYSEQKLLSKEDKSSQRKEASLLRKQVLERDDFTCQSCGLNMRDTPTIAHVDHIVPLSKGGLSTMENLQVLCANYNMLKGVSN